MREDKQAEGKSCKAACARNMPDRTYISEHPAQVDGKRSGDWEMDLTIGKNGYQAILVLVEKSTGYVMIHRLEHGKKQRSLPRQSAGSFSHTVPG